MDPTLLSILSLQRRRDIASLYSTLSAADAQRLSSYATALTRQLRTERNPAKMAGLATASASLTPFMQASQYRLQKARQLSKELTSQAKSKEALLKQRLGQTMQKQLKIQKAQSMAFIARKDPLKDATVRKAAQTGQYAMSAATLRALQLLKSDIDHLRKKKKS